LDNNSIDILESRLD